VTTSFPYFYLSQRLGLPYPQVLQLVERLEGKPFGPDDLRWLDWPELQRHHCDAIYEAWRGEVNRRRDAKKRTATS
jgi:hypothetical protein